MDAVIAFVVENWSLILTAAGSVFALAAVIAKATPTKKDDEVISLIAKVWAKFQGVVDKIPPKTK